MGSDDGSIYALKVGNGDKIWSYSTGGGIMGCPAVANGIVYVGSGDGYLYAFGTSTESSNSLFIIIGAVASVVIVAAVILLMLRKILKTKPTSPQIIP